MPTGASGTHPALLHPAPPFLSGSAHSSQEPGAPSRTTLHTPTFPTAPCLHLLCLAQGGFSLPNIIPFESQHFFTSFGHPDLSPLPRLELGSHKRGHQEDPKREKGGQDHLDVREAWPQGPLVVR